ncbi:MAG: L-histidine N(alpha)-methyltransferase [Methylococcales bacterium]|nr:L-histidine N(alpha)-methyltransferase [Methylococcales bacterium]
MSTPIHNQISLMNLEPAVDDLTREVVQSLQETPRRLSCRFFYDKTGAKLFSKICDLKEYYLTRTELQIMNEYLGDIGHCIGPEAAIIEFGSGSGQKTELLLESLERPWCYAPVDISREQLIEMAERMSVRFPDLWIQPVCADYNAPFNLDRVVEADARRIVYFPGSTIGNLAPEQTVAMLGRMKGLVGDRGAILLGLDLAKSREIIEPAYNDSEDLTAAFNLNALRHVNRVTGTNFNISAFEHRAIYRPEHYRVEMHLISSANQRVRINGQSIRFEKGEHIVTEYSHKYPLEVFDRLLTSVGLRRVQTWFDRNRWFSLQYIQAST